MAAPAAVSRPLPWGLTPGPRHRLSLAPPHQRLVDSSTFRFGPYAINRDEKLLRRAGEPVPLPLKAVETLLLLVQWPGRVVSKEDIMRAVWPDVIVEENNLTQQISLLRKALGNGAEGGQWIQTIPKRGYRFVPPEPVRVPVPVLLPLPELGQMKLRWILAAVALIALTVGAGSRLPGDAP